MSELYRMWILSHKSWFFLGEKGWSRGKRQEAAETLVYWPWKSKCSCWTEDHVGRGQQPLTAKSLSSISTEAEFCQLPLEPWRRSHVGWIPSLGQHLDAAWRDPAQRTQVSMTHRHYEIINRYCFKLLNVWLFVALHRKTNKGTKMDKRKNRTRRYSHQKYL